MVHLTVRNDSRIKGLYRTDDLNRLTQRVCEGEGFVEDAELSVLLCDDAEIAELNRVYRKKAGATDVLSFGYRAREKAGQGARIPHPFNVLGDIVISLETVEAQCSSDRAAMRDEVRLLFCHGLLHLLGFLHKTEAQCSRMQAKQAQYLGIAESAAWHSKPL